MYKDYGYIPTPAPLGSKNDEVNWTIPLINDIPVSKKKKKKEKKRKKKKETVKEFVLQQTSLQVSPNITVSSHLLITVKVWLSREVG